MSEPPAGPAAAVHPAPVLVGGFPTLPVTRRELAAIMARDCLTARLAGPAARPKLVFSSNGQGIAMAGRDPAFAFVMEHADIVHADGMPVVFASRLTPRPCPERVCTTDFFHDAARAAEAAALSFFMLGGTPAQNEGACAAIAARYPKLRLAGRRDGFFSPAESGAVCAEIRASGADVLWVALGKPRQEVWCVANREALAGLGWIKTCGGLYAHLAGEVPRAPLWMQRIGLEWLWRALAEPRRLGLRYLADNPRAALRLLRHTERRRRGLPAPAPAALSSDAPAA
jgi:N-acetylglucosaminyldiphosphoundecaprenol N-acetyl-beta-D-mannosaminyltransferase